VTYFGAAIQEPDTFADKNESWKSATVGRSREPQRIGICEGEIFANIWGSDVLARISRNQGSSGWVDLSSLRNELSPVQRVDVLNGIAYDAEHDRLFVTGKYWPKVFEIELIPPSDQ